MPDKCFIVPFLASIKMAQMPPHFMMGIAAFVSGVLCAITSTFVVFQMVDGMRLVVLTVENIYRFNDTQNAFLFALELQGALSFFPPGASPPGTSNLQP